MSLPYEGAWDFPDGIRCGDCSMLLAGPLEARLCMEGVEADEDGPGGVPVRMVVCIGCAIKRDNPEDA